MSEENESGLFDDEYRHYEENRERDFISVYHAVCNLMGVSIPYHDFMVLFNQFINSHELRLSAALSVEETEKMIDSKINAARECNGCEKCGED